MAEQPSSSAGYLEHSIGYLINLCARLFTQRVNEALAPWGVTTAYMPVVIALSEAGSLTHGELAAHASIEQPTMTRTLSRMVRDGLVVRSVDPADARRTVVRLTEKGLALVPPMRTVADVINREATARLDGIDEAELLAQLTRLTESLRDRDRIARAVRDELDRP